MRTLKRDIFDNTDALLLWPGLNAPGWKCPLAPTILLPLLLFLVCPFSKITLPLLLFLICPFDVRLVVSLLFKDSLSLELLDIDEFKTQPKEE